MKVLHLVGSQTSAYYHGVSMMYAPGCIDALPDIDHIVLLAHLDGTWSVLESLDTQAVKTSARLSLPEALMRLHEDGAISCMQPHMFDYKGMVSLRGIAELLDIPMIGSPGEVMALTTNKWQSRAVVASAGVPVPKAQLLRKGDSVNMMVPFIVKPCREDNSMGVALVTDASQIQQALETAFQFDDELLVEQYVPLGRELRVGVVDGEDGKLEFLPVMEYFLHNKSEPIRTSKDKISTADDNANSMDFAPVDRQVPASVDEELRLKLHDLATKSHEALGCKHYSLYDVRVDPEGNPFFIEASPYCSFSPKSALVTMSRGNQAYSDTTIFFRLAKRAISEYQKLSVLNGGGTVPKQIMGMRKRSVFQQTTMSQ
eukprot:scaffold4420_cov187-Amphora_coffeaeformis.AAC.12